MNAPPSTTPTVRRARADDVPWLASFNVALALETESKRLDVERVERGVRAVILDEHKGLYFVAELDGERVGQCMVNYEWSDWGDCWAWWIASVYVRPDARRKGVLRALFSHVEGELRARGDVRELRLYVVEGNTPARSAYASLSMRKTEYAIYERDVE